MFKVTLTQLNNAHDFESEKRKREGEKPDEVFLSIEDDPPKVKFEKGKKQEKIKD